jgi:hypothetical protein
MDKLAQYREIVRKVILEYATHKPFLPMLFLVRFRQSTIVFLKLFDN